MGHCRAPLMGLALVAVPKNSRLTPSKLLLSYHKSHQTLHIQTLMVHLPSHISLPSTKLRPKSYTWVLYGGGRLLSMLSRADSDDGCRTSRRCGQTATAGGDLDLIAMLIAPGLARGSCRHRNLDVGFHEI